MAEDRAVVVYPFKLFDQRTKRWRKARWLASEEDIKSRGGEICGPPEVRTGGGTAAHVQSSPPPSPTLPDDIIIDRDNLD